MKIIDLLKEDFSQTLEFIDKCDNHIFMIKNWAIITSSGVIAFAISQDHDFLSLVNLFFLLAFIYLELMYKSFQDTAIEHTDDISKRIDKYLVSPDAEDLLAGYNHSFGRKLKYPSIRPVLLSILYNKQRRHIINFYSILAFISVAAFVVAKFVS
ncbi:MAG: hypothetical protein WBK55_09705 [Alphaproteobacteria bacterium]